MSDTKTLIGLLFDLSDTIEGADGDNGFLISKAADTLEQLERENAALKAKVEVIVKNYEDYKAENAALRVALEDIMTETDEQVIWRMARAALEQKEAQP